MPMYCAQCGRDLGLSDEHADLVRVRDRVHVPAHDRRIHTVDYTSLEKCQLASQKDIAHTLLVTLHADIWGPDTCVVHRVVRRTCIQGS